MEDYNDYIVGIEALEPLSEGGSSKIFRGVWSLSGERVAVKVARPDYHDVILQEAATQYRLSHPGSEHPNIVKVITSGETGAGTPYFAMELMDRSLRDLLKERRLSQDEALSYLEKILNGLSEAHGKEVVHGDVKPGNILLRGKDEVKLSDFGLGVKYRGRKLDATTWSSRAGGTPEYVAPEIIDGKKPTPVSDIYSVGVLFHEMLTRNKPEAGRRIIEAYPDIPERIANILTGCLRRDPKGRIQDMGTIKRLLEEGDSVRIEQQEQSPRMFTLASSMEDPAKTESAGSREQTPRFPSLAWWMEDPSKKKESARSGEERGKIEEDVEERAARYKATIEAAKEAVGTKEDEVKKAEKKRDLYSSKIQRLEKELESLKKDYRGKITQSEQELREAKSRLVASESGFFGWIKWLFSGEI